MGLDSVPIWEVYDSTAVDLYCIICSIMHIHDKDKIIVSNKKSITPTKVLVEEKKWLTHSFLSNGATKH